MTQGTPLLDADGNASVATALMMSHHGMRRDLARFLAALNAVAPIDAARGQALKHEWKSFSEKLHGHHESEDTRMFPFLEGENPSLASTIDRLGADHRRIDPLLERGQQAFAELPNTAAAREVVTELLSLLDAHLETEEGAVVPLLRAAKVFPPPATDEEAALYAEGFAWSCDGVAEEVLRKVFDMLPEALTQRLPAARAAHAERCLQVWGAPAKGSSHTSVPSE